MIVCFQFLVVLFIIISYHFRSAGVWFVCSSNSGWGCPHLAFSQRLIKLHTGPARGGTAPGVYSCWSVCIKNTDHVVYCYCRLYFQHICFLLSMSFNLYFMRVILCKVSFIIIKANSSYYLDQEWRGPGGDVTHESKEFQQDDSNSKGIFWRCWWIHMYCKQQNWLHRAHNNGRGQRWDTS